MLSINNTAEGYLKNVEIKGNTIQDTNNLADIKSVGDKVEGQELYEIPLLSVGKNLARGFDRLSMADRLMFDLSISKQGNYIMTFEYNGILNANTVSIDGDRIGYMRINGNKVVFDFEITPNNLIKLKQGKKMYVYRSEKDFLDPINLMVEEGTQATTYEPYQENKLTILSPCQLEKVGDVADRIVEKDGVWGVLKLSNRKYFSIHDNWLDFSPQTSNVFKSKIKIVDAIPNSEIMVKGTRYEANSGTSGKDFEFCTLDGNKDLVLSLSPSKASNKEDLKRYVIENEMFAIYKLQDSIFIPLPHDQQVKLRTFANKTNISFLCDVEGTIKADVPKSLGATVNTHTTQIDSLNNELERVKKLEESTVSTVVTDKDFEVVEQTTQGYFEDVELKGRTLVNLVDFTNRELTLSTGNNYNDFSLCNVDRLVIDKEYTFSYDIEIKSNTTTGKLDDNIYSQLGVGSIEATFAHPPMVVDGKNTPDIVKVKNHNIAILKFKDFLGYPILRFRPLLVPTRPIPEGQSITYVIKNIFLVEGNYSDKPLSYFNGLASVGEGTDEIVVSSVDGDGNLWNTEIVNGLINTSNGAEDSHIGNWGKSKEFICVKSNLSLYVTASDFLNGLLFYDKSKTLISAIYSSDNKSILGETPSNCEYIRLRFRNPSANIDLTAIKDVMVIKSTTPKPYTPHKADKKKLLYFDPTDSTWKKPILDEFSTVKKGSDGVYRYYKRGEKVVLNGSENIQRASVPSENGFKIDNIVKSIGGTKLICDTLKVLDKYSDYYDKDGEGITLHNTMGTNLYFRDKTILTVEGWKQKLQANNVTVVYQLATEKVYECTNIDLITYPNETIYTNKCGVLSPTTVLKVHSNISNVVSLLQKKVSLLESNINESQATQNAIILDTDMRVMDIEFVLMESMGLTLNEGGNTMFKKNERGINEFNLMKERIESGEYTSEYLEKCINKYKHANRLSQEEYDILYDMIYPPVYDIPTVLPN